MSIQRRSRIDHVRRPLVPDEIVDSTPAAATNGPSPNIWQLVIDGLNLFAAKQHETTIHAKSNVQQRTENAEG